MMRKIVMVALMIIGFIWYVDDQEVQAAEQVDKKVLIEQLEAEQEILQFEILRDQNEFDQLVIEKDIVIQSTYDIKDSLNSLQKKLDSYRKQLTQKNNEIKTFRQKNKALLKGTKAQKNKYNKQLSTLQNQFKKIQSNITNTKNQVLKVNSSYTKLKNELSEISKKINEIKDPLKAKKIKFRDNKYELSRLKY